MIPPLSSRTKRSSWAAEAVRGEAAGAACVFTCLGWVWEGDREVLMKRWRGERKRGSKTTKRESQWWEELVRDLEAVIGDDDTEKEEAN